MQAAYGTVTPDAKRKVLGLNAARLYGLDVPHEVGVGRAQAGTDAPPRLQPS